MGTGVATAEKHCSKDHYLPSQASPFGSAGFTPVNNLPYGRRQSDPATLRKSGLEGRCQGGQNCRNIQWILSTSPELKRDLLASFWLLLSYWPLYAHLCKIIFKLLGNTNPWERVMVNETYLSHVCLENVSRKKASLLTIL